MNKERTMNMKQNLKPVITALVLAGLYISPSLAFAGERESLEQLRSTTMSLIQLLVQEGVVSKSKADALIHEAEAARQASVDRDALAKTESASSEIGAISDGGDKTVRVQYVPEHIKNEMREQIKKEVMAKLNYKAGERLGLPDWIDRMQWEGDIRLRYEFDSFPKGNAPAAYQQANEFRNAQMADTEENRNRFRVRARLGTKLKINDWLDGGIRMTTGSATDPLSPNQTLDTTNSKFSFGLDRVFLRAEPLPWLSVSGGRIENPWFYTDMVWDPDLAFDGFSTSFKPKLTENLSAFGTLGAFSLNEQESAPFTNNAKDKWLFGAQAGLQWKSENASVAKFGVALYDFSNVEGQPNQLGSSAFSNTVLSYRKKGNNTFSIDSANGGYCGLNNGLCGLASEFRELNLTGQIDLASFNPVHVVLTGDYVRNIGFNQSEILARTGNTYEKENVGYQVSLNVGMPKVEKRHDWQVFGAYKRIEADAVLDAVTDSDFHLGGTNTKGWILGGSYGLDKNTWLTARWFSADEISGLPLAIDVLLVDLNAKF
jgi:hypothetical protein